MPGCAAVNCTNSAAKGFLMKKFPKNQRLRKLWTKKIRRMNWSPSDSSVLCQNHFQDDDWVVKNGKKSKFLKPDTVPSIFHYNQQKTKRSLFKRQKTDRLIPDPTPSSPQAHTQSDPPRLVNPQTSSPLPVNFQTSSPLPVNFPTSSLHSVNFQNLSPHSVNIQTSPSRPVNLQTPSPKRLAKVRLKLFHSYAQSPSKIKSPQNKEINASFNSTCTSIGSTLEIDANVIVSSPHNECVNEERQKMNKLLKSLYVHNHKQKKEIKRLRNKLYRTNKKLKEVEKEMPSMALKKVFNQDQVDYLRKKSKRVQKWTVKTIKKAFKLRFACGSSGYTELLRQHYPLPSLRTLRRKVEHIRFKSGILEDVLNKLEDKVKVMNDQTRDCILLLDEMSIQPKNEYDVGTGTLLGKITLPHHEGNATHALVFMLAGLTGRWKQTVAYYFTGNSTKGHVLKDIILEIIRLAENMSLQVQAITTDMGPVNQAMWKSFGIYSNRKNTINSIPHPKDSTRKLFFIADVPHLCKNLRKMFIAHKVFIIDDYFVKKYSLPSNAVKLEHITQLCEHQSDHELKLATKINSDSLETDHFNGMKVSPAYCLLNRKVADGLKYLVAEEGFEKELLTTSWFLITIHKWFDLMTCRSPKFALSLINQKQYEEAVRFLEEIIKLLETLRFGSDKQSAWKPIQSGIILATKSVLELHVILLKEKNYKFVLTGRLTQDCLENLFSSVRIRQAVPSPLQFERHLKLITVSQYLRETSTSSYDEDDREFLGDFFEKGTQINNNIIEHEYKEIELFTPLIGKMEINICKSEKNSLYHLSGYIVNKVMTLDKVCTDCVSSLLLSEEDSPNSYSKLLKIKEYKQDCLTKVNDKCFTFMLILEETFRACQIVLPDIVNTKDFLSASMSSKVEAVIFPTCHEIKKKVINRFITLRLRIYADFHSVKTSAVDYGSKSICMRALVKNVKKKQV